MNSISPQSKLRLLVAGHSVMLCLVASVNIWGSSHLDYWEWDYSLIHRVVFSGLFFGQASLFVVWAAFGNTPAYFRFPSLLAIFVMLSYIYPGISYEALLNDRWNWEYSPMVGDPIFTISFYFVELMMIAVSILAPLLLIRWFGLRIPGGQKKIWYRFSLFDALAWTFFFAVILATCRWLSSVGWTLQQTSFIVGYLADSTARMILLGMTTALLSIIILKEVRPTWQLLFSASLPVLGSLGDFYLIRARSVFMLDNTFVSHVAMYLAYALVVAASLRVIRSSGLVLQWKVSQPREPS